MNQKVTAVIPARMGSRRFSGKVLYPYLGKPLLFYVWNEVRQAKKVDRLLIATDQAEVARAAEAFGAETVMTSKRHRTGTDRVAEAVGKTGGDIVINIQADNFGLTGALLDRVVATMKRDKKIRCATLAFRVDNDRELFDPDLVKLVINSAGEALWFSRFPVPFLRDAVDNNRTKQFKFYGHIGVYFFRKSVLDAFAGQRRTPCEIAESLEQLRVLENGGKMRVFTTRLKIVSVDSPKDLQKLDKIYNKD
ncbi:MAG: 3-deoxy-manno-octulosonate cytidylyltransferase [candidate division Zixibacteria bacterium]|nr:3-deoxy-manno-octulosonate cytidylyltransferase [candidate division Zixibacteria bacterium]